MKAELKQQWIEALKSGQYQQNSGKYKKDDCYCVMGVLLDISQVGGWNTHDVYIYTDSDNTSSFRETFGMTHEEWYEPMHLNDIRRLTFPEIAQWIDENIPTS